MTKHQQKQWNKLIASNPRLLEDATLTAAGTEAFFDVAYRSGYKEGYRDGGYDEKARTGHDKRGRDIMKDIMGMGRMA